MKIKNIKDSKKFFELLCHCKGTIELVSSQGDRINLKSTLCQYIALAEIFGNAEIGELELIASEPEDVMMLMDYLVRG